MIKTLVTELWKGGVGLLIDCEGCYAFRDNSPGAVREGL